MLVKLIIKNAEITLSETKRAMEHTTKQIQVLRSELRSDNLMLREEWKSILNKDTRRAERNRAFAEMAEAPSSIPVEQKKLQIKKMQEEVRAEMAAAKAKKCIAIKQNGVKCTWCASPDSDYCRRHAKNKAQIDSQQRPAKRHQRAQESHFNARTRTAQKTTQESVDKTFKKRLFRNKGSLRIFTGIA